MLYLHLNIDKMAYHLIEWEIMEPQQIARWVTARWRQNNCILCRSNRKKSSWWFIAEEWSRMFWSMAGRNSMEIHLLQKYVDDQLECFHSGTSAWVSPNYSLDALLSASESLICFRRRFTMHRLKILILSINTLRMRVVSVICKPEIHQGKSACKLRQNSFWESQPAVNWI